jgi:quinolinate synthase
MSFWRYCRRAARDIAVSMDERIYMDLSLTAFETLNAIQEQILELKKEKKAIILGHNYQRKEVQEISDFLGDSYGLSVQASKTDAKIIVFCGVDFMAESAKILNPQKIVLHPNLKAKCPMAAMVDVRSLKDLKAAHPGAPVVSYVNTSAEVKAESDICCTSANAVKIVQSLPDKKIIFVPDTNLGLYVQRFVKDKEIILWPGYCPTHVNIKLEDLKNLKRKHPEAEILVHPECTPDVVDFADFAFSTEGIIKHVVSSPKREFIIGTEANMLHRLRKEAPSKILYEVPNATCPNMREISLEDVRDSLVKMQHKIEIPPDIIKRAKIPLERMIAAGR